MAGQLGPIDYPGMATGIYSITCAPTGKVYIGSTSQSFGRRWGEHRRRLRKGDHHSRHLQRAWVKHGEAAFVWTVLVECSPDECLAYEQVYIDLLRPEFNISPTAGSVRGLKHSDATKAKVAAASKANNARPEVKAKIAAAAKVANARPEVKAKRAAAAKAAWDDPTHRAKLLATRKATNARPEVRARLSASVKAAFACPESKAKRAAAAKAVHARPEVKAARLTRTGAANTSGHRGVSWCARRGKWKVQIAGRDLGLFGSMLDAVAARLRAERALLGVSPGSS